MRLRWHQRAWPWSLLSMENAYEILRVAPFARRFAIGDLLFAHVTCPPNDGWSPLWSQYDFLVHILTGRETLRTATNTLVVGPGETVFIKKGALLLRHDKDDGLCLLMFFLPDRFIRETVWEASAELPLLGEMADTTEPAFVVQNDVALQAFFRSMAVFFASAEPPPELLLKLKLKELIASILVSAANPKLSGYLRTVAQTDAPSIPAIMEANFQRNLSLEEFARLCHRSLSTFKREFRTHYRSSPGKWLLDRRLQCAANFLRTTSASVTEIAFECGFEDASHFCHAFKDKFRQPPSVFRDHAAALV
jgi:AraC family transcriptional regulator, exoenzyme S synthesis regulatory protein ExsA